MYCSSELARSYFCAARQILNAKSYLHAEHTKSHCMYVCVFMCMHVSGPEAINN